MSAVVILVALVLLVWLLARAGVFRAFGRAAPRHKIDTRTREIAGLPPLPVAMEFRPLFRYEMLPALQALGEIGPDEEADGIDDVRGCAKGMLGGRRVWMFSRPSDDGEAVSVAGAVVAIPADTPRCSVWPTGVPSPITAGALADETYRFDEPEFDRAYAVWSPDEKLARALVDSRMREFLLSVVRPWSFSVGGSHAMACVRDLEAADVERFLQTLVGFAERIPEAVRSGHPVTPGARPARVGG